MRDDTHDRTFAAVRTDSSSRGHILWTWLTET